ncbi:MAG: Hpt domain-containing protein [Gammaproteobacteria bacterium]|nr:Hpt domain-containing protein [Gammaproteobacteria bacterium]
MSNNNINITTINELKEILEDDIFSLFQEFRSNAADIIKKLKSAADNNNTNDVLHLAHTIKGSSGNLGLKNISDISQQIETSLRLQDETDIASLISKLETSITSTLAELTEMELLK